MFFGMQPFFHVSVALTNFLCDGIRHGLCLSQMKVLRNF